MHRATQQTLRSADLNQSPSPLQLIVRQFIPLRQVLIHLLAGVLQPRQRHVYACLAESRVFRAEQTSTSPGHLISASLSRTVLLPVPTEKQRTPRRMLLLSFSRRCLSCRRHSVVPLDDGNGVLGFQNSFYLRSSEQKVFVQPFKFGRDHSVVRHACYPGKRNLSTKRLFTTTVLSLGPKSVVV